MSVSLPDTDPMSRARAAGAPLLDLLRTVADQYGEITFRVLPPDHEQAATGSVVPADRIVNLPAEASADDVEGLVYSLYALSTADVDPRCADSAEWFVAEAAHRTMARMGGAR